MPASSPYRIYQCKNQPGNHGHVQTGNTHEMIRAGTSKHLPLLTRNSALVAHRERGQNACISMVGKRLHEMLTNFLTQTLDSIRRPVNQVIQARILVGFAHVAVCPDVPCKGPFLEIETVGIDAAMRPLEPYHDLPAFTRTDGR